MFNVSTPSAADGVQPTLTTALAPALNARGKPLTLKPAETEARLTVKIDPLTPALLMLSGTPVDALRVNLVVGGGLDANVGIGGVPSHNFPAPTWLSTPGVPRSIARDVRKLWS